MKTDIIEWYKVKIQNEIRQQRLDQSTYIALQIKHIDADKYRDEIVCGGGNIAFICNGMGDIYALVGLCEYYKIPFPIYEDFMYKEQTYPIYYYRIDNNKDTVFSYSTDPRTEEIYDIIHID